MSKANSKARNIMLLIEQQRRLRRLQEIEIEVVVRQQQRLSRQAQRDELALVRSDYA